MLTGLVKRTFFLQNRTSRHIFNAKQINRIREEDVPAYLINRPGDSDPQGGWSAEREKTYSCGMKLGALAGDLPFRT
jgi:hypothetical protein